MRGTVRVICVGAMALGLAGCATHEQSGAVGGAAAGAATGSLISGGSVTGALIGGLVGSALGSSVGRDMDEQDRMRAAYALQNQPVGQPYSWTSTQGDYYTATPTRAFNGPTGPCREFVLDVRIDGRPDQVRGTACQGSDGVWRTQ